MEVFKMAKKTMKRILSTLLCAAVLVGGSMSASAAELSQSRDASYSTRSSLEDLVQIEPHAIVHGGQRYTHVDITIPEDAIGSYATVTIRNRNGYATEKNITFNGNTACYNDYGTATDILDFEIYLNFSDGNLVIKKTVNPFDYICGMSHELGPGCYSY